jgi:N-dimethylarginine dimethylaminohydrolase
MAAGVANNQWMKDLTAEQRSVNSTKAKNQFFDLYSLLTDECLVYLIPPRPSLQDQIYTSNAGAVLPHCDKVFIKSNFRAEARTGEEVEAAALLERLGYECVDSPYYFEGEAELKWLRDNIYIGGHGTRSSLKALEWLSEKFDARIIPVEEKDPYLYHLDCSIFPLSSDLVLAYTAGIPRAALREMERYAAIIPVTKAQAYAGATNSVRLGYTVYNDSCISELPSRHPWFPTLREEQTKNKFLETVCRNYGLELTFVNMSETLKSGALLSCCILHLAYDQVELCKP